MNASLYSKTPTVTVLDNRGLAVRDIAYCRHPDSPETTSERITRHQYDARGFLTLSADPRLYESGLANFCYLPDLNGGVLRTVSADAGRPFMAVNAGGVTCTFTYEDAELSGRPLSITEQPAGEVARITERFMYAGNTAAEKALNLAGQCVSHYDTAGLTQTDGIALSGVPLSITRRLLKEADNPDVTADWQGEDASAWNDLLDGEACSTLTTADATGAVLTTTDAKGNLQRVAYDVAGLLSGSWLTLKDGTEQAIVVSLTYSAAGQKLREEHGNGVVTTYTYESETQRLAGIKTERPAGHASGAKVLQDLRYEYDPVGNVLKISNDAEETRFWRNQKVVPENVYAYDSLYQLVSATGREMANAGQQDCNLPTTTVPLPTDSSAYTNYTRTYTYDTAGNLTQISHSAPATKNSYTTAVTVSDRSNRGILSTLTENPSEVDAQFTAGGQQKRLQPGQNLVWTPRNELRQVTPVVRDGDTNDGESYRYDAGSQRILKVSVQKTGNSVQTQRVQYLPGLELRTTASGTTETESLQVITVGEAGRAQVRVLHWASGRPGDITDDQIRYSYDDLTGSGGLELDNAGSIISMEEYYPYGGTAILTARSSVEADYKNVRYSGKVRDATGLYYYGYRYYQPWVGRWLSADPAGTMDGLNLFRMCRNNPVTLSDPDGLSPSKPENNLENEIVNMLAIKKNCSSKAKGVTRSDPLTNLREDIDVNISHQSPPKKTTGSVENELITKRGPTYFKGYGKMINFLGRVPWEKYINSTGKWFDAALDETTGESKHSVYGSNFEINYTNVFMPINKILRRNSITQRPIIIMSGTHGHASGDNWTEEGVRRPELLDQSFYDEDVELFEDLDPRIKVINSNGMDVSTFKNHIKNENQHVILAYCFSRNDEALRHHMKLDPVTSYLPPHIEKDLKLKGVLGPLEIHY